MPNGRPKTHFVGWVQQKDFNGVIYFSPEIFDNFGKACKTITSWDREEAVANLTKGIEMTKAQKMPSNEDLENLPKIGQHIWVVKNYGESAKPSERYKVFGVTVTEFGIENGEVQIIFGFYYKKKGEWFYSEKEANNYRQKLISAENE